MINKYWGIFLAVVLLIVISFGTIVVCSYVKSLILMEDEITFSASVIMAFLSSPIMLYVMLSGIYFFIFDKRPKYDKAITRYLIIPMFSSFIIGLPVSFYVDYKLKSIGYLTCDRISWQSPTTYVKDLSLCK